MQETKSIEKCKKTAEKVQHRCSNSSCERHAPIKCPTKSTGCKTGQRKQSEEIIFPTTTKFNTSTRKCDLCPGILEVRCICMKTTEFIPDARWCQHAPKKPTLVKDIEREDEEKKASELRIMTQEEKEKQMKEKSVSL
jgi:hypothetical protein